MEVSSGNFLWELASVSHEVEQLSSPNVFQNYRKTIVCGLIFFLVSSVFSNTDKFN